MLSNVSFTANRQPVVTEDDFLMKEYLVKYEAMRDVHRVQHGQRPGSVDDRSEAGLPDSVMKEMKPKALEENKSKLPKSLL